MFKELMERISGGGKPQEEKKSNKIVKKARDGAPERKGARQIETISKKEHIPVHLGALSIDGSEIPLTDELQKNYIVILLKAGSEEDKGLVCIISSTEMSLDRAVDNNLLTIKKRCQEKGYSISQKMAPRQIIQIAYDEDKKRRMSENSDDKKKKDGFIADFDSLATSALEQNISDIHIEIRRKEALVRFRKHGELMTFAEWQVSYAKEMASVLYQVMASEKEPSYIETKQQAARIERNISGFDLGIRLNTMPVSGGNDVVMRLLKLDDESEADKDIDVLGYSQKHIIDIRKALSRPTGVIIIAGTTGSGKSTSLSTMLNGKIRENWGPDGPTIKVITVEDPTEYTIIGASQHGVVRNRNKPDENPFAEAIKAAMRCDPDILMVGEVRDPHSSQLLVGAVQSGHTVLTTVHAASAIGIIPRMKSFGVASEVLGSSDFISALIYQTLIPVVCDSCGQSIDDFEKKSISENNDKNLAVLKRLKDSAKGNDISKVRFRNHDGCDNPECVHGVVGRTVVAEVVLPNAMVLSAFEQGSVNLAKYYHLKMGGKLILDHGIEKILEGISDPMDVEKKLGRLDSAEDLEMLGESLGLSKKDNPESRSRLSNNAALDKSEEFKSRLFSGKSPDENDGQADVISISDHSNDDNIE